MATKTSFSCGEQLDINAVHALQERLYKSLDKSPVVEMKADAVAKADTAGLQLCVALKKELLLRDGQIVWKKPTDALIQAAEQLGLADELGLS